MQADVDPKIVVIGLGYVGLPLAVALAESFETIGLDIDPRRINELRSGLDATNEIVPDRLKRSTLRLTDLAADARGADIYIVTVPTPVDSDNNPDLGPVISATRSIAPLIDRARPAVVVYESTVYPGVTEDICGPILEASGLIRGTHFWLGYSPERINPGDRHHTIDRIVKVVAGENAEVTERLAHVYSQVTNAGVCKAASIKVAEAAKVIENAQRDINIAFMNEVTQIFHRLEISIWDVLEAASSKWNFLPFQPGLVGGHCIGVDPFYLSHLAQTLGHKPDVILAGRAMNDHMGFWVAERFHERIGGKAGSVLVLGFAFKENVPDMRNTRVIDLVRRLAELGHDVHVHDPFVDAAAVEHEYGIQLEPDALSLTYDAVFLAVPHAPYAAMSRAEIEALVVPDGCVADLKGAWRKLQLNENITRWQL